MKLLQNALSGIRTKEIALALMCAHECKASKHSSDHKYLNIQYYLRTEFCLCGVQLQAWLSDVALRW